MMLLVALSVLALASTGLSLNIKKSDLIERYSIDEKNYKIRIFVKQELAADSENYLVFYASSSQDFSIKLSNRQESLFECSGHKSICLIEIGSLKGLSEGLDLLFSSECRNCKKKLGIAVQKAITLDSSSEVFFKDLKVLRISAASSKNQGFEKVRLGFQGYSLDNTWPASLVGVGNKDTPGWPTLEHKDFALNYVHQNDIASVFYKGDSSFCDSGTSCKYRLLLQTSGLWKLNIAFTYSFGQIEELQIDRDYVGLANLSMTTCQR